MQKVFNVIVVIVLALLALFAFRTNVPYEAPIARTTTTYNVTNGAGNFVFAGTVYTVSNGQVALDDAQYAYYKPLISAGVLVQAGATGSNVFVNSTLARIGSGGSLDVQSGATFTVSAPIIGNPAITGNLTVSGTSALVGAVTTTGAATVGGALNANGAVTVAGALVANTGLSSNYITASTSITTAAVKVGANTLSGFQIISQAITNGLTINHNLGVVPKIICQPMSGGSTTSITDTVWISASTATNFTVGVIEALKNTVSTDTINVNCLLFR